MAEQNDFDFDAVVVLGGGLTARGAPHAFVEARLPLLTAICKGVQLSLFLAFRFAPKSTSSCRMALASSRFF